MEEQVHSEQDIAAHEAWFALEQPTIYGHYLMGKEIAKLVFVVSERAWLTKCVPENHVVVSKEPTEEMIDNYMKGKVLPAYVGSYEEAVKRYKENYAKLIASAGVR